MKLFSPRPANAQELAECYRVFLRECGLTAGADEPPAWAGADFCDVVAGCGLLRPESLVGRTVEPPMLRFAVLAVMPGGINLLSAIHLHPRVEITYGVLGLDATYKVLAVPLPMNFTVIDNDGTRAHQARPKVVAWLITKIGEALDLASSPVFTT